MKDIKLFRRRLSIVLVFTVLTTCFLLFLGNWYMLAFNMTDSVKGYVFFIDKTGKPKRDDLIAFVPPKNGVYDNISFIKYIKGIEGDVITKIDRTIYINGFEMGVAKPSSLKGLKLKSIDGGEIPHNKYFVWSLNKDSFDSRYKRIGLIDEKNIIGTAYRIF